jgi:toxin secretion/phage lysis holin
MEKVKIAVVGFFAVATSWLGTLAIPVYILVACNVIDYVTGITAACVKKEQVSSYKGILGIAKKVFMYLLVLVGVFVDLMLQYMFKNLNIPISLPFVVGCIVACWLVLNEMLSILENLNEIGVPMPPFLMPLVERIRGTVEKKGEDIKDNIGKKEDSSDE